MLEGAFKKADLHLLDAESPLQLGHTLLGSAAAITGGMALGVMSLFNGDGRPVWGSLSDHMGKRTVVVTMYSIAELFGPIRIGANYGLMFTAWGAAGFTVPRWMAGLLEQRKAAGDLAGGYNAMFYWLAALAGCRVLEAFLLCKPSAGAPARIANPSRGAS